MTTGDHGQSLSFTGPPHRGPFLRRPGTVARRPASTAEGGVPLDIRRDGRGEKLGGGLDVSYSTETMRSLTGLHTLNK